MKPTKVTKYDCGNAGCHWHNTREDAEVCCRRFVEEVELWMCPHCYQKYRKEETAKRCCEGENNG